MNAPRWLLALALLGACTPNFTEQWEVKKPRLMVAKLSIDGDTEGRTRPLPGESFSIRYYMMSPEKPQESYDIDVAACIGLVQSDGTLSCYEPEDLAELETLLEQELGTELDLNFTFDLEVEPYAGDDQLLVHGFMLPDLLGALPPSFDSLDRLSSFGTMCVDGRVERAADKRVGHDPISELFRCTDNDEAKYKTPLPFTMSIFVDRGQPGQLNHHPSFLCDESEPDGPCQAGSELYGERVPGAFVLERPEKQVEEQGGERVLAWPAWDTSEPLPWDGCADAPDSLPKLRAESGEYKVHVRFDASDREDYERQIEENGEPVLDQRREQLIVSHAITTRGGELRGYASALDAFSPGEDSELDLEIDVDYTPPRQSDDPKKHIDESGRLVRFYFALRDQRGGADFTTRELCVLPPED